MLVVTGIIEIVAADMTAVKAAAADMARETRQEPGCIVYEFFESVEKPGRFRIYEEWQDLTALQAHFQTLHMATFRAVLQGVSVVSREIVRFDRGPVELLP